MTDDEIISPSTLLLFPDGHKINVHEIWEGQVLYCVIPPNGDRYLLRKPVKEFIALVREQGARRA